MAAMVRRVMCFVVLVVAFTAALATLASAAGATTWHNTGSTAFTATGGPGTLSIGASNLTCGGSTATGTAPGGTIAGTAFPFTGTAVFTPCTIGISGNWYVHCQYVVAGVTQPVAGQTAGAASVTCDTRFDTSPFPDVCHIRGTTPVTYVNPSGTTPGRLTLSGSTSLVVTNGSTASCPIGNGTATLTEQALRVTSGSPTTLGPVLTRTP
jgi:hypothetical protein